MMDVCKIGRWIVIISLSRRHHSFYDSHDAFALYKITFSVQQDGDNDY